MKTTLIAACVSLFAAAPVFAGEPAKPTKAPGPNFEQHKTEILERIDERIARNQEEKSCVQAAKNPGEVRACQEKFVTKMRGQRQDMKKK